jgi:hypothetical protein
MLKQLSVIGFAAICTAAGCVTADATDDDVATSEQTQDSVVASGTQCFVDFSIDHRVQVASVGPATLVPRAQSTATPSLFSPTPGVASIDHVDFVSVTPSALANNQVPVSNTVSGTQTSTTGYGAAVLATVTWNDGTQFQNANLCTATATTTITVHLMTGRSCVITKTTNFPTCVPVK